VDATTCFTSSDPTVPQGPCKTLIEQLSGKSIPSQVAGVLFSTSQPQGAVMALTRCQITKCDRTCDLCPAGTCFQP